MGGFRSNGLNGTSNNGGGYNKDGTSSLLLDPATQQTYSDAPFSGLWRPESPRSRSDEEQSSSAPLRFRRLPRHWRVLVAAAVAIVCLLLLWFFLISPALFRKKIPEKTTSPIKESPISSKVDPVAAVVPASKTPKNQSTSLPAAETPQKKPKDDVYVSEIHNLPTERPSSTKIIDTAEQITTDSADFDEDDMLVLDRIELPTNGSQSSSTIVFSRIPAVEKGFQPKPVTMKPSPVVPTKTSII
jgi:hypothetical protein